MPAFNNEYENGSWLFTISYSERELSCLVEKRGDILDVLIDNEMQTRLRVTPNGDLNYLSGEKLPDSTVFFIKKQLFDDFQQQ